MALGKADTGLIQADRAAYTATDPMLGLAAGAGAMAGQFINVSMKQMEDKAKKQAKQKNDFADAYTKGLDDNSGFAHDAAKQWLTNQLISDSNAYAASSGDMTGQNEIITGAQSYTNQLYRGEGRIKAHREVNNGRQTRALNSDATDTHFQDELGAGNYTVRKNDNGVIEWGVKNPDGYKGEKEDDGFTWFTEENLPLGSDYNFEGGTYTLNIFDTEVNKRVDGYEGTAPGFKNKYKTKFTEMNMNYFDLKTLIAQDPEGDGIEGNDFYNKFYKGELPNEYYRGIGEKEMTDEEIEKIKNNPIYLKSFLNGENANGTRDYNNLTNRKDWIIDKFSQYMGEVTTDGYNTQQRKTLEKNNRYFMLPGEDGMFMGKSGKAPTEELVKTKRLEVYKDLKFDTILGENYDPDVVDFTQLISPKDKEEDSPLFQNIAATYANHMGKNGELKLGLDDGKLVVATTEGGEIEFDFNNKSREEQLKTMDQLKSHLATLGPIDTELEALGTDAREWKFKKGEIFPAVEEVQEEREAASATKKTADTQQLLKEMEEENGPITKTDSYMGGTVYFFENGSSVNSADLEMNLNNQIEL